MIKRTIKYVDYNGQQRTETAYFNLNKLEVLKLTAKLGMGIEEYTQKLAKSEDVSKMLQFIEDIILMSYGQKTDDGRSFYKSPEKTSAFENSNAFAELFEQLLSNTDQIKQFASGIVGVSNK